VLPERADGPCEVGGRQRAVRDGRHPQSLERFHHSVVERGAELLGHAVVRCATEQHDDPAPHFPKRGARVTACLDRTVNGAESAVERSQRFSSSYKSANKYFPASASVRFAEKAD